MMRLSHAIWLYHRFCRSFGDVEDLLAERGILASYDTIRQWCRKFGLEYARRLKRRQGCLGDTWHFLSDDLAMPAKNGVGHDDARQVTQDSAAQLRSFRVESPTLIVGQEEALSTESTAHAGRDKSIPQLRTGLNHWLFWLG
jgi:hypothetical protein